MYRRIMNFYFTGRTTETRFDPTNGHCWSDGNSVDVLLQRERVYPHWLLRQHWLCWPWDARKSTSTTSHPWTGQSTMRSWFPSHSSKLSHNVFIIDCHLCIDLFKMLTHLYPLYSFQNRLINWKMGLPGEEKHIVHFIWMLCLLFSASAQHFGQSTTCHEVSRPLGIERHSHYSVRLMGGWCAKRGVFEPVKMSKICDVFNSQPNWSLVKEKNHILKVWCFFKLLSLV